MGSILAVVAKKVFETDAKGPDGKLLAEGAVWPTARYASTHAALKPLESGGHIFLATVRPPDDTLWLVAVLLDPKMDGTGWSAAPNAARITNVNALKPKIKFTTGAGIKADLGKLGMSLQTPRALTPDDEKFLLGACGLVPGAAPVAAPPAPPALRPLNRHETKTKVPCLCRKCIGKAPETVTVGGCALRRAKAEAVGRVLHFWMPDDPAVPVDAAVQAVADRMRGFLGPPTAAKKLDPVEVIARLVAAGHLKAKKKDQAALAKKIAPFLKWTSEAGVEAIVEKLSDDERASDVELDGDALEKVLGAMRKELEKAAKRAGSQPV